MSVYVFIYDSCRWFFNLFIIICILLTIKQFAILTIFNKVFWSFVFGWFSPWINSINSLHLDGGQAIAMSNHYEFFQRNILQFCLQSSVIWPPFFYRTKSNFRSLHWVFSSSQQVNASLIDCCSLMNWPRIRSVIRL